MIIPIELRFKADKDSKSVFRTDKTIKSHDVNSVEFHITIDGLELTDNHTAKILSVFHSSESQVNMDCEIVDGKIIYKPDTNLISRHEHVTSYVYVYKGNQSLDVREFIYIVDPSKIDETSLEVKEVYDQSYADLLADFEQALSDYKDSLPQADSVRADIDEILNQFSEDSQAKLSQYDADANAIIEIVEANESAREVAETTRKTAETDRVSAESTRKTNETTRISNEEGRVSAESVRVSNEAERISKDSERDSKIEEIEGNLESKTNKQQEEWIVPTLINGWENLGSGYPTVGFRKDEFGVVHLKGSIKGTVNIDSFVLPVGYRPSTTVISPAGSYHIVGQLRITRAGIVTPSLMGINNWIDLTGISFPEGVN